MAMTSLQLGERFNWASILPRLLALAWSAYCAHALRRPAGLHRSRGATCSLPAVSLATVVSTATVDEDIGAREKKND